MLPVLHIVLHVESFWHGLRRQHRQASWRQCGGRLNLLLRVCKETHRALSEEHAMLHAVRCLFMNASLLGKRSVKVMFALDDEKAQQVLQNKAGWFAEAFALAVSGYSGLNRRLCVARAPIDREQRRKRVWRLRRAEVEAALEADGIEGYFGFPFYEHCCMQVGQPIDIEKFRFNFFIRTDHETKSMYRRAMWELSKYGGHCVCEPLAKRLAAEMHASGKLDDIRSGTLRPEIRDEDTDRDENTDWLTSEDSDSMSDFLEEP